MKIRTWVRQYSTTWKSAESPGDLRTCHLLFIYPGVCQDMKKATQVLDSSCAGGLADSCNMLAKQLLRRDGKGPIPRDPPRAQTLLEKGCSHNHGPSCYNLTVMYKQGDDGVAR